MPLVIGNGTAWGDDDGYFSLGDPLFAPGAGQDITQGFAVPEGFDSVWVETPDLVAHRLSNPWTDDSGNGRVDEDVPVPGFLSDGVTPAYLTCIAVITTATTTITINVVAVNQAFLVDHSVRVAVVLDLALGGDTFSRAKLAATTYSGAHAFGVVAAPPNLTSYKVTLVPGAVAVRKRGTRAQLSADNTTQRSDGELALVAMPDAATNPFAAYDSLVEGAGLSADSALVAVWGPRNLEQASTGSGDDHAINGAVTIGNPSGLTFPIAGGIMVGRVGK